MKTILPLLLLALLCGCDQKPKPRPIHRPVNHSTPPLPPMPSQAATVKRFGVAVFLSPLRTNTTTFVWSPSGPGAMYNFYYGTNSGHYLGKFSAGLATNYLLTTTSQLTSTNPVTRIRTFPDGKTYTNVSVFYFVVTALATNGTESVPSNEAVWPPPPPPPFNAMLISWGSVSRNVTIQQSTNLTANKWSAVTNVTGTSVLLPMTGPGTFYRGVVLTNQPVLILSIVGSYLPTNQPALKLNVTNTR